MNKTEAYLKSRKSQQRYKKYISNQMEILQVKNTIIKILKLSEWVQ